MSRHVSTIATGTPEFRANRDAMEAQLAVVGAEAARILEGGTPASKERHVSRGKLLPRERVEGLIDPGSPFLEIGLFAAKDVYDDDIPAAGVIAGVGRVEGRDCMIVCNDATVKGGPTIRSP